jgi:polyisoprenoid-binding protein YceI
VWTDADGLTRHLKSPDFFDVAKYPRATFESTEIRAGGDKGATHTIVGNLTLHGVTKGVAFPVVVSEQDAAFAATAEFSLNRKDFGVAYPGMPDDLIRDEVVVRLKITGKHGKSS